MYPGASRDTGARWMQAALKEQREREDAIGRACFQKFEAPPAPCSALSGDDAWVYNWASWFVRYGSVVDCVDWNNLSPGQLKCWCFCGSRCVDEMASLRLLQEVVPRAWSLLERDKHVLFAACRLVYLLTMNLFSVAGGDEQKQIEVQMVAEQLASDVVPLARAVVGVNHPLVLRAACSWVDLQNPNILFDPVAGQEMQAFLSETVPLARSVIGDDDPLVLKVVCLHAVCDSAVASTNQQGFQAATELLEDIVPIVQEAIRKNPLVKQTVGSLADMVVFALAQFRYDAHDWIAARELLEVTLPQAYQKRTEPRALMPLLQPTITLATLRRRAGDLSGCMSLLDQFLPLWTEPEHQQLLAQYRGDQFYAFVLLADHYFRQSNIIGARSLLEVVMAYIVPFERREKLMSMLRVGDTANLGEVLVEMWEIMKTGHEDSPFFPRETYQVLLQTLSGETITIDVFSDTTLTQLKEIIRQKRGILPERVTYCGKELRDPDQILNLQVGTVVEEHAGLCGGGAKSDALRLIRAGHKAQLSAAGIDEDWYIRAVTKRQEKDKWRERKGTPLKGDTDIGSDTTSSWHDSHAEERPIKRSSSATTGPAHSPSQLETASSKKPDRKEKIPKPCAWCGTSFTPKRDDQKLCEPGKSGVCYKERDSKQKILKKLGITDFSGDKTTVNQRIERAKARKNVQAPPDPPTGITIDIPVHQEQAHDGASGYDSLAGGSNTPGFTSSASNDPSSAAWGAYSDPQATQGPLHPCGICSAEVNASGFPAPCSCWSNFQLSASEEGSN
eukprot:COSAG02_NODE_2_length_75708_cov_87.013953_55_plen_787_part_00